jgi:hypothetical protein
MFKNGSKFLFGLAGFGYLAAFLWADGTGQHPLGMDSLIGPLTFGYKGYVGDHVGYALFIGLATVALFLGVVLAALRDADADAVAQVAGLDTVPEVPAPQTVNFWPVVAAFSLGAIALGLAVGSTLVVIGLVGLVITTVEWAARAWSDRATGDPAVNRSIRNRLMYPVEIPGVAVLGIGGLVLAVSRILLALPKYGSYAVFALVPMAIAAVGILVVFRPRVSQSVIAAILLVGGLAILGGGVVAAIQGPRPHDDKEQHAGQSGLAPNPAVLRLTHGEGS